MTETMYRRRHWNDEIEIVQVAKKTSCFVWFLQPSTWTPGATSQIKARIEGEFFPTWEAAHAYMVEQAEQEVKRARENFDRACSHVVRIRGLKREAA